MDHPREPHDDYPHALDDGHEHQWEDAEGLDTGTDADAIICTLCGAVSVRSREL